MKQENVPINYNSLSKSIVISIFSALCAYILVFLYSNYVTLYFAYDFDITAFVNLKGINFEGNLDTSHWSRDALITILMSKPLAAGILGIGLLVTLMIGTKKPVSVILLLFWLNVFAFNTAFGILIDDAIARSGTYEVAVEMSIGNVYLLVMSILMTFFLYKIGMMNGRLIITSFPHQNLRFIRNRIVFFFAVFLFPWLLVVGYTYLSGGATNSISELIRNLPVLILLIPFLTAEKIQNIDFKYLPTINHSKFDIILSVIFVMLALLMVIILHHGITITG